MRPEWKVCATKAGCHWLNDRAEGWQFGESGFLKAICERLGIETGVEIGAGDGESLPLTLSFIPESQMILFESDDDRRAKLRAKYPKACIRGAWLRNQMGFSEYASVVVVDVDSFDLKIAENIASKTNPAVLCVEHADLCGPGAFAAEPPPDWLLGLQLAEGGFVIQASALAIEKTLKPLGYVQVGMSRVNSIFVRSDLVATLEGC